MVTTVVYHFTGGNRLVYGWCKLYAKALEWQVPFEVGVYHLRS